MLASTPLHVEQIADRHGAADVRRQKAQSVDLRIVNAACRLMLAEYRISNHRPVANEADGNGVEQALRHGPFAIVAVAGNNVRPDGLGLNDRLAERVLPNAFGAAPELDDVGAVADPVLGHLGQVGPGDRIDDGLHVGEAGDRERAGGKAELGADLIQNFGPAFRRDHTIIDLPMRSENFSTEACCIPNHSLENNRRHVNASLGVASSPMVYFTILR